MIEWVAVLHDTHTTAGHTSDALRDSCLWLAANYEAHRIVAVLHTGDFVNDASTDAQWSRVAAAGFPIDGLPCIWTTGNHDVEYGATRDATKFNTALPPAGMSALAGSYEEGSAANTYHIITIAGRQWLVLALEFDPRDAVVLWADGVLDAHSNTPAIVITHAYLYRDGEMYDKSLYGTQEYLVIGLAGGDNYGQQLWDATICNRGNVAMVFCGHDVAKSDGTRWGAYAYQAKQRREDAMFPTCHHFLRNFQGHSLDTSGSQYMTLIGFDSLENKIYLRELSPPTMLDRWYPALCTDLELVTQTGDFVEPAGVLLSMSQGTRNYYSGCRTAAGDNLIACYGDHVFKLVGGSGDLVQLSNTQRNWLGCASPPSGDNFAIAVDGGTTKLYKQAAGAGAFVDLGIPNGSYRGITITSDGTIYLCTYTAAGKILVSTNNGASFSDLGVTARNYYALYADPSDNVYAVVYSTGGGIWRKAAGSSEWAQVDSHVRNWIGIGGTPNGDIYATDLSDVYKQVGGTGDFTKMTSSTSAYCAVTGTADGGLIAGVYNGELYKSSTGL